MSGMEPLSSTPGSQAGVHHASADYGEQDKGDPVIRVGDQGGERQAQHPPQERRDGLRRAKPRTNAQCAHQNSRLTRCAATPRRHPSPAPAGLWLSWLIVHEVAIETTSTCTARQLLRTSMAPDQVPRRGLLWEGERRSPIAAGKPTTPLMRGGQSDGIIPSICTRRMYRNPPRNRLSGDQGSGQFAERPSGVRKGIPCGTHNRLI
jgi:hypothetical protein